MASDQAPPRPCVLVICDGWGIGAGGEGDAIARARTPNYDRMRANFPATRLFASGEAVGLPEGQMGNSEVGHLNLGAGRMVPQDILRIDLAIRDGSFFENPALGQACASAKRSGGSLHLLGLVSDGGVHSHERHLFTLLELARRNEVDRVFVHAFLDGRDTPPRSALRFLEALDRAFAETGRGAVATVSGRYYAMDRDRRWDRVKKAYDAMVHGRGRSARAPSAAVEAAYARGESDEFVEPTVIERGGNPIGRIEDGDSVVFFNVRADRARQMTQALTAREFDGFDRGQPRPSVHFVGMTEYKKEFALPAAFPPLELRNILAEVWGRAGRTNLRVAETEKYAHVTYFFNGGVEQEFPGESRILVPSPKVSTYDLAPEMSAGPITEEACAAVESGRYDAIVLNYANADMVGHTGKIGPTISAVEYLDGCIGRLLERILEQGGVLLMTGDHGNAEQMIDSETGEPQTAHTTNPVPLIVAGAAEARSLADGGSLRDVAPTLLGIMRIAVPREMTGRDLRRN
jgi:2,3-bisphosphoglycerate-independent phosphoglycerate mutase